MNRCKSCGVALVWAKTIDGRTMPLNASPDPTGNIELVGGLVKVLRKTDPPPAPENRYLAHFATCPAAQRFRKAKR